MITLPKEPWRGGQLCGWQLSQAIETARASYCGEPKMGGEIICYPHYVQNIEGGELPDFADGNEYGHYVQQSAIDGKWRVFSGCNDVLMSEHDTEFEAREAAGQHDLKWEPCEGDTPEDPTPEELADFAAQLEATRV